MRSSKLSIKKTYLSIISCFELGESNVNLSHAGFNTGSSGSTVLLLLLLQVHVHTLYDFSELYQQQKFTCAISLPQHSSLHASLESLFANRITHKWKHWQQTATGLTSNCTYWHKRLYLQETIASKLHRYGVYVWCWVLQSNAETFYSAYWTVHKSSIYILIPY